MTRLMGIPANRVIATAFAISGCARGGRGRSSSSPAAGTVEPAMGFVPGAQGVHRERHRRARLAERSRRGRVRARRDRGRPRRDASERAPSPFRDAFALAIVVAILYFRPEGLLSRPAARHADAGDLWRRTFEGTLVFAVPLALIAVLGNALASPADLRVIVNFMIALVLVLAIQSFSGNSGIVSFGHVGFMGVGAYVAALLTIPPTIKEDLAPSLPGFIADNTVPFVAGGTARRGSSGALVAAVVGLALTRMQEGAMAMATIGILVIFFVVFDNWEGVTRGATGLFGIPRSTTVWSALVFAVIAIAICRAFRESATGLELRASRTDSLAAEALGANVVRLRWWAWTLSGVIMGWAARCGRSTTSRSARGSSSSRRPSTCSRCSSSEASPRYRAGSSARSR